MSAHHNSALRQSKSIRSDLDTFSSTTTSDQPTLSSSSQAALQGQITTSLTAFSRTLTSYQQSIEASAPTKGPEWVERERGRLKQFQEELDDYRSKFQEVKSQREHDQHAQNRGELFGGSQRRTGGSKDGDGGGNPYADTAVTSAMGRGENVNPLFRTSNPNFVPGSSGVNSYSAYNNSREDHALREQSFFSTNNDILDGYIARGQAVLGDLGQQREVLKSTQKKLYDVGATLGISGDTIRMVERRAKQDKWIFWGGVIVFIVFCWLVLRYLR